MNPFTQTSAGSVGEWGEVRLIGAIQDWLGSASPPPPIGIGDDCAVFEIHPGAKGLVTTDPVIWGRHFDDSVSPEDAAGKLFRRNLSDIAAMGGRGNTAVISLLLPSQTSRIWLERFFRGLASTSHQFSVPVAGGDVSQTDGLLGASMTLIGETTCERALTRNGADVGDHLFVTGSLGGSRRTHHFSFEPRLAEGQWLVKRREVVAGMDISDGLAKDLLALLPPGGAAELFPDAMPISEDAFTLAATSRRTPLYHALCDGEDHELLFAIQAGADLQAFKREWRERFTTRLSSIGRVVAQAPGSTGAPLHGLPPEMVDNIHGYEHLR